MLLVCYIFVHNVDNCVSFCEVIKVFLVFLTYFTFKPVTIICIERLISIMSDFGVVFPVLSTILHPALWFPVLKPSG